MKYCAVLPKLPPCAFVTLSGLTVIFNYIIILAMAFDGSAVCALTDELNKGLEGGQISKIIQPGKNELQLTIKKDRATKILFISTDPSLPVMYLTDEKKEAPLSAPAFCMLLRKHLQGGKILSVSQPTLERIINIEISHYDEMGDLKTKILTIELMGKHSNMILRNGNKILDSIRHISSLVSSVREVLPGREYFIPFSEDKLDPFKTDFDIFLDAVAQKKEALYKGLYLSFTGFSPDLAQEICYRAGVDADLPSSDISYEDAKSLYGAFSEIICTLKEKRFMPEMIYRNEEPVFFGVFEYKIFKGLRSEPYESISALLKDFYGKRQAFASMKQKSSDLRRIVMLILARDNKKYDLQLKQIRETEKKDKFRVYGELLTAYGYSIEPRATSYTCEDFYTGKQVTIPLDPTLSAIENGKKYFEKYAKLKRTYEALSEITKQTEEEIKHLESIRLSLENARSSSDLAQIKREMHECGYIKSRSSDKKGSAYAAKADPLHFVSSDGFDIYVGKNNYQNEYISFKLAEPSDWWFHAKKIPGSHVIVKALGKELPDKTFEEAAALAAYFSSGRNAAKVDVDYTLKKNLKKPAGAKPGFVIYHTNYSMTVKPSVL